MYAFSLNFIERRCCCCCSCWIWLRYTQSHRISYNCVLESLHLSFGHIQLSDKWLHKVFMHYAVCKRPLDSCSRCWDFLLHYLYWFRYTYFMKSVFFSSFSLYYPSYVDAYYMRLHQPECKGAAEYEMKANVRWKPNNHWIVDDGLHDQAWKANILFATTTATTMHQNVHNFAAIRFILELIHWEMKLLNAIYC